MGFTLIEIMVVIAIVAIMTAIIITVLSKSRDKGEDGKRQEQLSHLRSVIENETNGAGYASEFNNGTQAKQILDQMILGAGYTAVDNGSKYEYQSDSSSYVVIFPLKSISNKYWCIDSTLSSTQVSGLLAIGATKNCNNATRGSSGGASPTIVLTPPSVVGYTVYTGVFTYNGSSVFGVLPSSWAEPSYTASDPEDGDLTANVQIIFPDTYTPHAYNPKPSFLANIKSFFTNKKAEAIGGGGGCLAVTTRHYRVTDGSGHSTDAYRDFTSVC